jgi:hypothetical protein
LVGWALPTCFNNGMHCTPKIKLSTIPKACGFEAATFIVPSVSPTCHMDIPSTSSGQALNAVGGSLIPIVIIGMGMAVHLYHIVPSLLQESPA